MCSRYDIRFYTGMSDSTDELPFSLVHYLGVKSAVVCNPGANVVLCYEYEPSGDWWSRTMGLEGVIARKVAAPRSIFGVELSHPVHRVDVQKLLDLKAFGGIVMDLDVISLKCLEPLLRAGPVVIGKEGLGEPELQVCAAVLVTSGPNTSFVNRWLEGYDPKRSLWHGFRSSGRDDRYAEICSQYPMMLARMHPNEVKLMGRSAFYPYNWTPDDVSELYGSDPRMPHRDLTETYAVHLWQQRSWSFLKDCTIDSIRSGNSPFARAAALYVQDDAAGRPH